MRGYDFSFYDDLPYIKWNPHVRSGFSWENVSWAFTTFHESNWHPATWLSHMLDVELFGLDPGRHHLTGVVLHAFAALLLFAACRQLTGRLWRSAAVAALFAAHPLNVESVAWIAERKNVLSTIFLLLTVLAYRRYLGRPGPARYSLVVVVFAAGLMAKPMLVTLPFALLLLDIWPLGRAGHPGASPSRYGGAARWRGLLLEKLPLLALSAASSAVTLAAQRLGGSLRTLEAVPFSERVGNAAVSYAAYVGKALWPAGLAVLYPWPDGGPPAAAVAGGCLLLIAFTGLALRLRGRAPYALAGWLWYLGTLVPVIGFVQVGNQSMADRYAYVPLMGLFVSIVWGCAEAAPARRARHALLGAAATAVVAAFASAARLQVDAWRDVVANARLAAAAPRAPAEKRQEMGRFLAAQGRLPEAEVEFRAALDRRPGDAAIANDLGKVLHRLGRREEARTEYLAAARAAPDFAEAHFNLGLLAAEEGRLAEAAGCYRRAIASAPCAGKALNNLGGVLYRTGRAAEAEQSLRDAIHCQPDLADAYFNLGVLLEATGRSAEAADSYAAAVWIDPGLAEAGVRLQALRRLPAGR